MNILLANAPWIDTNELYGIRAGSRWPHLRSRRESLDYYPFPFMMAYAASSLRQAGFDVTIVDCIASGMNEEEFTALLQDKPFDLVILETSTPSIAYDLKWAKEAKNTGAYVALVGQHATAQTGEVLLNEAVDFVMLGEYDQVVVELAKALTTGGVKTKIAGVCYSIDNSIHLRSRAPLIKNLDERPYPARDNLPMEKYIDPFCKHAPNAQMISSRGCPYACSYCLEPHVFYGKQNYRMRSAESVVEEMKYLVEKFGAREIYLDDASFSVNQKRVLEICEKLKQSNLGVAWSCMADAKLEVETLRAMRESGCVALKFGVESADLAILKNINKPVSLEDVRQMARNCREVGIETHATYAFGLPGETPETIRKTIDFAFELDTETAQFSVAIPYPGTPFYSYLERNRFLTTDDWSCFNGRELVFEYPDLSKEQLLQAVTEARRRIVLKTVLDPQRAYRYAVMIKNYMGWRGLLRTGVEKVRFLMGW